MSSLNRLIQEIHRRGLWQMLAIYIGGPWLGCRMAERQQSHTLSNSARNSPRLELSVGL